MQSVCGKASQTSRPIPVRLHARRARQHATTLLVFSHRAETVKQKPCPVHRRTASASLRCSTGRQTRLHCPFHFTPFAFSPRRPLVPVALVVVLACRRLTAAMPSLYPDPSAEPPVLPERIMLMIQEPVRRLNQPLPVWYSDVEASVGKLIRLGVQTSLYPDAVETKHKLQAISEAISPVGAAGCVVDKYLGRGTRDEIARRYDCFSLSLALGLIDSWLRSCEDYMRRNCNKRIKDDLTQLSQLNRELGDISRRHGIRDYSHDSVFHLFDSLGLLGADRPRHAKFGLMHIWFVRIADYWHRRRGKWRRRRGQDLEPDAIQKGYEQ